LTGASHSVLSYRLLAAEHERAVDQAIVEGYTRIPPSPEDDEAALASTRESIREKPW
jgi:hypothetical protein